MRIRTENSDNMLRPSVTGSVALFIIALFVTSCDGTASRTGHSHSTSPSSTPTTPTSVSAPPTELITAQATVRPDQGVAGTVLVFSVQIRGPGTLQSEAVKFGDGNSSGANAGEIACGETTRADHTSNYMHAYATPGTYRFSDEVTVQAPPPSCVFDHTTASLTVVVAAPLSDATLNGAFVSPTKNIACYVDETPPGSVRCASFSPPRLVTMDASGSIHTCMGNDCDLGNPAMETPVLPYGTATAGGPFECLSSRQGIACTIAGHRGFELSREGIRMLS
jgi:hypothetical protein